MKLYKVIYWVFTVLLTLPLAYLLIMNIITVNLISATGILVVLAVIWLGCRFATKNNSLYACLCALVICFPLLYRLGERFFFIQLNGGMEGKDGFGSPLAFLIGMFFEGVLFVPFLILAIYGAILWRKKSPSVA